MLVFKEFENNEFSILDTEDNVIESISGDELLNILCTTDLEIQGLSLNSKGFVVDDNKTVLYKPVKVKNSNLTKAKKAKNDEFYTQLSDIEKELSHYPIETFKDKVIYCPCDSVDMSNGYISNFAIYFYNNFKVLGIKKLICTCYSDGINYFEYNGKTELKESRGSGDFRSEYCTRLLQEADIVVTNPPFSLFGDFIKLLISSNKQYLIVGNRATYSQDYMFEGIKNNTIWTGYSTTHQVLFTLPHLVEKELLDAYNRGELKVNLGSGHDKSYTLTKDGHIVKGINACWYTNIHYDKQYENLLGLSMQDNIDNGVNYKKYDDFDAIDISKTAEIPMDYEEVMGVPISFIDKYNPKQFELIQMLKKVHIDGKVPYARILIRHRKDENGKLI